MNNKYKVLTLGDNLGGMALAFQKAGFEIAGRIVFEAGGENIAYNEMQLKTCFSHEADKIKELPHFSVLAGQMELLSESTTTYKSDTEKTNTTNTNKKGCCDNKAIYEYIYAHAPVCFFLETRMNAAGSLQLKELISQTNKIGYKVRWKILETQHTTGKPIRSKRLYIVGIKAHS